MNLTKTENKLLERIHKSPYKTTSVARGLDGGGYRAHPYGRREWNAALALIAKGLVQRRGDICHSTYSRKGRNYPHSDMTIELVKNEP